MAPLVVLGSSSLFRKQLLEKLGLPFICHSPKVDETPYPGEAAHDLVTRLALSKAQAVAAIHPHALIISSDQVSVLEGQINGKPGTREKAIEQLIASSGKRVRFHTSLCVYDATSSEHTMGVEIYDVKFRTLNQNQISRYVDKEAPFNCAGGFKSEGYGITLFEALEGRDPNSLIGLPLILLVDMLQKFGVELP